MKGLKADFPGVFSGSTFDDGVGAGSGSRNGTIFGAALAFLSASFVAAFAVPRCFRTTPFILSGARTFSLMRSFRVPSSGQGLPLAASASSPDGSTNIAMRPLVRDELETDVEGAENTSSEVDGDDAASPALREFEEDAREDAVDKVDVDSPRTLRRGTVDPVDEEGAFAASDTTSDSLVGAATIILFWKSRCLLSR